MVKSVVLATIILVIIQILNPITYGILFNEDNDGLFVVVTFSNLLYDVKQLLCPDDVIRYIVPPGVDPHEYQLTENDVKLLERADIIISTGHAPFEVKIRELYGGKKVIIEIPFINNITLLINPMTGNYNYHMPIYDPFNYLVFINNTVKLMAKLNPRCKLYYEINGIRVSERIKELIRLVKTIGSNKTYVAIGDKPFVQYGVHWLGVRIKYLLIREHGVPVTAHDYVYVNTLIANRSIDLVVVTYPVVDKASSYLLKIARENNIPVLLVPAPFIEGSIVEKLENITGQFLIITGYKNYALASCSVASNVVYVGLTLSSVNLRIIVSIILVVSSIVLSYYYYVKRIRWFI